MARKAMTEQEMATRKAMLANETKSDKFRRVMTSRVVKALKALSACKTVTGPQYMKSDAQVDKIENVLVSAVDEVITALRANGKAVSAKFEL